MNDKDDILGAFGDVAANNADVAMMLSHAFAEKWGGEFRTAPVVYVDYVNVWNTVKSTHPEVLGTWDQPLVSSPALEAVVGQLAEPLADYVTLTRRCSITQAVNLFVSMGYLEMTFDPETGREAYHKTDKKMSDRVSSGIEDTIAAYSKLYA